LYRENSTTIYAKPSPVISDSLVAPLEGIVVVVDPGHGGKDPGALSILGDAFPTERELNLANALMLKYRLEQLGANVVLTRDSNELGLALYERMAIAQEVLPDFFISLHHNSIAESSDVHDAKGVESYYYYDFGKVLGENVTRSISLENYERIYRHVSWSYYTVTRMRYTPSILTEIAFMPHPIEYMRACDTVEIYKTANAIACALLESMSSPSNANITG
jgi:N-acetylmuramoyl-L-alanine amidase